VRDVSAYVRAYARPRVPERQPARGAPRPGWRPQRFGERVLVFDIETTLDPAQRLLVGAYQLHEWSDTEAAYRLVETGLIRGDGLPLAGTALLKRYAQEHDLPILSREQFAALFVVEGYTLGALIVGFNLPFDLGALALPRIRCRPRKARTKVRYRPGWGRGRGRWRRGFRVTLLDTVFEPRLRLRHAGDGAAFVEWGAYGMRGRRNPREPRGRRPFAGRFLDLREVVYALVGEKHSLESASQRFGVPLPKLPPGEFGKVTHELIDHCCRDVELSWRLFLAVRKEWGLHPFTPIPSPIFAPGARAMDTPDLSPHARLLTRMRSPASLAKAYLDLMGIRPRLLVQPDFPPERLGEAMEAFFGGRIEARPDLQGTVVPVVALDIASTYLSANVLFGLHRWDTAAHLAVEEATDDARRMLDEIGIDDLFHPDLWPGLAVFCEVEPHGDVLPVRYPDEPGDAPTCHVARVHPGAPGLTLWYALPDLLYSKLVTGRAPVIRRAWRIVPEGTLPGLRPVRFREGVVLDPRVDYLRAFRAARLRDVQPRLDAARADGRVDDAQELDRLQRAMKAVGEPLCYGIYVEVIEKDLLPRDAFDRGEARADVWTGQGHFEARIAREEYPGQWFFSPRGAIVTAGARLLLGMMERLVNRGGGCIVSMHTDSALVVCTETGGDILLPPRPGTRGSAQVVHALSVADLECIRERFISLSGIPGVSLWKREHVTVPHLSATRDRNLYVLSYGPGKYALFNQADDGRILLRDRKETALGHLIPPPGYTRSQAVDMVWQALIRDALGERDAVASLPFARDPALGRLPITTPDLLRRIHTRPRGSRKQTAPPDPRPFGFLTVAYTMSDLPLFGRHTYWSGVCRFKKVETVGCPAPREACPHRASCPLAYPIQPATYDVPGPDLLETGRWFDWRTGRPLPRLHTMPMDTWPHGVRVRTWAEYVRHTVAHGMPWWEDQDSDVRVVGLVYTVKESRHLEDIGASLRVPADEVLCYQPEPADPNDEALRAICRRIPMTFLVERTRVSRRALHYFRSGRTRRLRPAHRQLLWQAVTAWARDHPEAGMISGALPLTPQGQEAATR